MLFKIKCGVWPFLVFLFAAVPLPIFLLLLPCYGIALVCPFLGPAVAFLSLFPSSSSCLWGCWTLLLRHRLPNVHIKFQVLFMVQSVNRLFPGAMHLFGHLQCIAKNCHNNKINIVGAYKRLYAGHAHCFMVMQAIWQAAGRFQQPQGGHQGPQIRHHVPQTLRHPVQDCLWQILGGILANARIQRLQILLCHQRRAAVWRHLLAARVRAPAEFLRKTVLIFFRI